MYRFDFCKSAHRHVKYREFMQTSMTTFIPRSISRSCVVLAPSRSTTEMPSLKTYELEGMIHGNFGKSHKKPARLGFMGNIYVQVLRHSCLFVFSTVLCAAAGNEVSLSTHGATAAASATTTPIFSDVLLPGTGTVIRQLDFESSALLTQKFNYGTSWSGAGFSLSGTQRGAPEYISVTANPAQVMQGAVRISGGQVLSFYSGPRDSAWYAANPEALTTTTNSIYKTADTENQDDFFMYSDDWVAADRPTLMVHFWLDAYSSDAGGYRYTSLRMPVIYNSGSGETNYWPGVWLYQNSDRFFFRLRRPAYNDYEFVSPYQTDPTKGGWWTLGLAVEASGDMHYFAAPGYATNLTLDHYLGSAFAINALQGEAKMPILRRNDAVLMTSNYAIQSSRTLIDDITYTKGAVNAPEDLQVISFARLSNSLSLKFNPKRLRRYNLVSSKDLLSWSPIATDISPGITSNREWTVDVPFSALQSGGEDRCFFKFEELK